MSNDNPKKFSPVFFAFALFCFLLPFLTVSCPGGRATLSGYELVTGTQINGQKVTSEPLAVLAFVAVLLGLGMSFSRRKEAMIGTGIAGAVAAVILLILQSKVSRDVANESGGTATVSYEIGYWLAVLALAGGAAFSFYIQSRLRRAEDAGAGVERAARKPDAPSLVKGTSETSETKSQGGA